MTRDAALMDVVSVTDSSEGGRVVLLCLNGRSSDDVWQLDIAVSPRPPKNWLTQV